MHAQITGGRGLGPRKARAGPVRVDIVCFHAWNAKNSHARSGSGARAQMMDDQCRGHEQEAKGVKKDKDIPSKPLYGLCCSSMTGVSMWAKTTQQQNPKEDG